MLPVEKRIELLRLIAHPIRIKILEDLTQGVKCVSDFEESLDISQPNVSQHLKLLRSHNIVDYFIDGRLKCYFLKEPLIPDLLELLKKEYDDDIPAPACCPVTKKGTYPGERRRWLYQEGGMRMTRPMKNVSIMCFHDELCQVYNALMTALSLLRESSKVTMFFGSRGINAVHKDKVKELKCLPDQPKEEGEAVMKKMEEMDLPSIEDLFFMLIAEGATVLACPLNVSLFSISPKQLIDGVKVADPAKYYKETVIPADMNLTF